MIIDFEQKFKMAFDLTSDPSSGCSRMVSPFPGGKERKSRSKEPGIGRFPYGKIQGDPREGFPIRIESLLYPSTWKDQTLFETLTPLLVPIEPPDETSK